MRIFLIFLPLLLFGGEVKCNKCELNKNQMKCEYYVAKKGDISKSSFCKTYADYLYKTKVYGKAAWYYLLSKEPKKALDSSKKAILMGENFAYEFLADSYLILGDLKKAKANYGKFKNSVSNAKFFTKKSFEVLSRIYKDFDKNKAENFMK